jgi:hypothetical protein
MHIVWLATDWSMLNASCLACNRLVQRFSSSTSPQRSGGTPFLVKVNVSKIASHFKQTNTICAAAQMLWRSKRCWHTQTLMHTHTRTHTHTHAVTPWDTHLRACACDGGADGGLHLHGTHHHELLSSSDLGTRLDLCRYPCVCVCMCACVRVCVLVHECVCVCVCGCVLVSLYVYVCMCVHACLCSHIHATPECLFHLRSKKLALHTPSTQHTSVICQVRSPSVSVKVATWDRKRKWKVCRQRTPHTQSPHRSKQFPDST